LTRSLPRSRTLAAFATLVLFATSSLFAEPAQGPEHIASKMQRVRVPDGFQATWFAGPPEVRFPTVVAAEADGTLWVGTDANGSLGRGDANGAVVRLRDKDNNGTADEFVTFIDDVDSPRGLAWDGEWLYVLHPPHLTAYRDTNGDGKADEQRRLVEGIGFDLGFRGADHTTNGIVFGIDGWIYVAVGDYGFKEARGTDGTTLVLRGGGVVRVRPDGSQLELISRGQRNIYDVAFSPKAELFTRDNTNDGDGWDVRLSHVVDYANYGYPSLYKNFADEAMPPLAELGGGSPTGSLWVNEAALPAPYNNMLLTCEWGRQHIYRHTLTDNGAGYTQEQHDFIGYERPVDVDVDASGRIFAASWEAGKFTGDDSYSGYILEIRHDAWKPIELPDLKTATVDVLLAELQQPSASRRFAAQRELLRRELSYENRLQIAAIADNADLPIEVRIAAVFTARLAGVSPDYLTRLARHKDLRATIVRSIADGGPGSADTVPNAWFLEALRSDDPKLQREAIIALVRLERRDAAPQIFAFTQSKDPVLEHTARQGLVELGTPGPAIAALASSDEAAFRAACRVLRQMHTSEVVNALSAQLKQEKDTARRVELLTALVRLYYQEDVWKTAWWGTRPDHTGPYYDRKTWSESEAIAEVLQAELKSDSPAVPSLLVQLLRHRVEIPGWTEQIIRYAETDPSLSASAVGVLAGRKSVEAEAAPLLTRVAMDAQQPPTNRVQALSALRKLADGNRRREVLMECLTSLENGDAPVSGDIERFRRDFIRDRDRVREAKHFVELADSEDAGDQTLALAVLASLAKNDQLKDKDREKVEAKLAEVQADATRLPRLLTAIAWADAKPWKDLVAASAARPEAAIHQAAIAAAERLDFRDVLKMHAPSQGPTVGELSYEAVLEAVAKTPGDGNRGAVLFERISCGKCHTVDKAAAAVGPYLGDIAKRYSRAELTEAILKPSAKLAQGFETQIIITVEGRVITAFVTREAGEELVLRDAEGKEIVLPKDEIDERETSHQSVMPEGLAKNITPADLASIVAYLEKLAAEAPATNP
jgi:putative membrane-bound dehydrogenase-like protein